MARASDALRGGGSIGKIPKKSTILKSLGLPSKAEKESVRQADETPIDETNPEASEKDLKNLQAYKRMNQWGNCGGHACTSNKDCCREFPICDTESWVAFPRCIRSKAKKESVRQADETPIEETNPCLEHPCNLHAMQQQHIRLKDMSKCQRAKFEAESDRSFIARFVPSCEPDGTYSPTQFFGSTGYSWCALADGTEVPGTRTGPGVARNTDCSMYRDQDDCRPYCECPPGYEGTEPFCYPVATAGTAGLVRRSIGYPKPPSCYERPCTSHLDCEDCDLACWNDIGRCNEWAKLLSSP